jgi:hypothetical protein
MRRCAQGESTGIAEGASGARKKPRRIIFCEVFSSRNPQAGFLLFDGSAVAFCNPFFTENTAALLFTLS